MTARRLIEQITLSIAAVLVCAILLPTSTVAKDTVPFKAVCYVEFTDPSPPSFIIAQGKGVATHAGDYTSTVSLGPTMNPAGPFLLILTAANGDQLFGIIYPNLPIGNHVEIVGGTGRFLGATGSWDSTITAFDPDYGFTEVAIGQISSVGANKKKIK